MNRVKQGHTKFAVVVYEPGKLAGYDNEHVACVLSCFVTKVTDKQIHYHCSNEYPYLCTSKYWHNKLFSTRRKAVKEALRQLKEKTS